MYLRNWEGVDYGCRTDEHEGLLTTMYAIGSFHCSITDAPTLDSVLIH